MPKVSVIIPSYNHSKYITQAIQSVLNQTYQDFEIVIVDDGSSDNSVEVIRRFNDIRIRLFCFEKNQGACVAIKKLIEEAWGEYIALLNSDDAFLPEKLEKQVMFLDNHLNIGAVFSYAQIIDEDGKPFQKKHSYSKIFRQTNRTRHEWLRRFFYHGNCLCHPSILIRKECYDKIGLYDPRYRQLPDFDFWIRLCMQYEIYIMPEELIQFRIRDAERNTSGRTPENEIRDQFEFSMILEHYAKIKSIEDIFLIFDHWQPTVKLADPEIIPFLVAQEALQQTRRKYWLFGLTTMHKLLADINLVNHLKKDYSYGYNEFFNQLADHDILNIFPYKFTRRKYWSWNFKATIHRLFSNLENKFKKL